jgi:hypothetical protein
VNPTISIPGNFRKTSVGTEWLCEIETAVSDLPSLVTGFAFHAHITFSSSASVPAASVSIGKAEKPRTIPSTAATIALSALGAADMTVAGTFGDDHSSGIPILIAICAEGTDDSDSVYVSDMSLELTS